MDFVALAPSALSCPVLAMALCVCVQKRTRDTQADESENPDNAEQRRCACRNAHTSWHQCVDECAEKHGCDQECKKNLPDQKRIMAHPEQALYDLYASLPGPQHTAPRAELFAILKALEYGISSQIIVCDHKNHVVAIMNIARGNKSVLNAKTPNVDVWRNV